MKLGNYNSCTYCDFMRFWCEDGKVFFKCLKPLGECKNYFVEKSRFKNGNK